MTDLVFHPLSEGLPLIGQHEFDDLVASITANGLREPITLYEGKILDGRNRYRACLIAGVPLRTEEFQGDDPVAFVCDKNIHRRHLTPSQKAMIMAQYARLERGNVSAQRCGASMEAPRLSNNEAAQIAGVGRETIVRAKTVIAEGTDEEIAAVRNGHATVRATVDKIKARTSSATKLSPGPRIKVPEGYANLTVAVRAAIELERNGRPWTEIKLAKQSYLIARDVILLSDMIDDLSKADAAIVKKCLQLLESGTGAQQCTKLIRPVAQKVWGHKGNRFKNVRVNAFRDSLVYVQTTCEASADMGIPYLSKIQRKEALKKVAEAIASLQTLCKRLKKGEMS